MLSDYKNQPRKNNNSILEIYFLHLLLLHFCLPSLSSNQTAIVLIFYPISQPKIVKKEW